MDFKQLNQEIQACTECSLSQLQCNIYDPQYGYGKLLGSGGFEIMLIGQNPSTQRFSNQCIAIGVDYEIRGSGDQFRKMLRNLGIDTDKIYFTNVVKCSTWNNEPPLVEIVQTCGKWLKQEIELVQPKRIVAMGRVSQKYLNSLELNIPIFSIWHYSYVSHQSNRFDEYNKQLKESLMFNNRKLNLADFAVKTQSCNACGLAVGRNQVVFGVGSIDGGIMLVGEAPGYHEDLEGKPFVGQAGQFLDELLHSIGLKITDVYITNIVKCRPPNNRTPTDVEIAACMPYLLKQIEIVKPQIIVVMGQTALSQFLPKKKISEMHGKGKKTEDVIYFCTYHPAAALHNRIKQVDLEEDFRKLKLVIEYDRRKDRAISSTL